MNPKLFLFSNSSKDDNSTNTGSDSNVAGFRLVDNRSFLGSNSSSTSENDDSNDAFSIFALKSKRDSSFSSSNATGRAPSTFSFGVSDDEEERVLFGNKRKVITDDNQGANPGREDNEPEPPPKRPRSFVMDELRKDLELKPSTPFTAKSTTEHRSTPPVQQQPPQTTQQKQQLPLPKEPNMVTKTFIEKPSSSMPPPPSPIVSTMASKPQVPKQATTTTLTPNTRQQPAVQEKQQQKQPTTQVFFQPLQRKPLPDLFPAKPKTQQPPILQIQKPGSQIQGSRHHLPQTPLTQSATNNNKTTPVVPPMRRSTIGIERPQKKAPTPQEQSEQKMKEQLEHIAHKYDESINTVQAMETDESEAKQTENELNRTFEGVISDMTQFTEDLRNCAFRYNVEMNRMIMLDCPMLKGLVSEIQCKYASIFEEDD